MQRKEEQDTPVKRSRFEKGTMNRTKEDGIMERLKGRQRLMIGSCNAMRDPSFGGGAEPHRGGQKDMP